MKKSILFVVNTLSKGGAETALLEFLRKINPREYDIDLYVLMQQGELVSEVPSYVNIINKKMNTTSVLTGKGKMGMLRQLLVTGLRRGTFFRLFPYMLKNGVAMLRQPNRAYKNVVWRMVSDGGIRISKTYDLAVAYLEGGSTYYVVDHVNAKKKVGYLHVDYEQASYTRALDRDCYLRLDHVFAVSIEVRDIFLRHYPELMDRCTIFYNIINQEKILQKAIEDDGWVDDYNGIRILTVGRLNYQKGYDIAIKAMRRLKEFDVDARWYVLGDGELRDKLMKQVVEYGLEEDFYFMGAVENPYPYFEQCDIYVHATRFEGKSIAIQEAMTLGCPVVASDCVGNRELIEEGVTGILCDLSPEGIVDAVMTLIHNTPLRTTLGRNAAAITFRAEDEIQHLINIMA